MKLKSKKYIPYKGNVYDIGVETKDHSYSINGAVVHNSAAGSLVSYCLGITKLDPIKYGLIFERFLNPGRVGKRVNDEKYTFHGENGEKVSFFHDEWVKVIRDNVETYVLAKEVLKKDEILM